MSRLMIVEVPSYSSEFKGIREVCELVRCGECKYYNDDYTGKWCGRFRDPHGCRTDDFCSYGEREGE